jgi:hypothetical protein
MRLPANMYIVKIAAILLALVAPPIVFAQPAGDHNASPSVIEVQRIGDNGYRMILTSYRSTTVGAGQAELMPRAAALCAPLSAQFGKYAFDLKEPVVRTSTERAVLVLRQEIQCGATPSVERSQGAHTSTAPRMATPEQVRRVEQQTRLYFDATDQGRYTDAYGFMGKGMKQGMSFAAWKQKSEAFNAGAGPVQQRTISKITWYFNPPQVAQGLYAAVDYTSKFAEIDLHCGFLAWHEQPDGKFVLVREEVNYVDKQTRQKLSSEEVEKIRQQFGCK